MRKLMRKKDQGNQRCDCVLSVSSNYLCFFLNPAFQFINLCLESLFSSRQLGNETLSLFHLSRKFTYDNKQEITS